MPDEPRLGAARHSANASCLAGPVCISSYRPTQDDCARFPMDMSHPDNVFKFRYVTRLTYVWEYMSSGRQNEFAVSHPDQIRPGANLSGWLRVKITLCDLDDIGQYRKSSRWYTAMSIRPAIRMRYGHKLPHLDDLGFELHYVSRMG